MVPADQIKTVEKLQSVAIHLARELGALRAALVAATAAAPAKAVAPAPAPAPTATGDRLSAELKAQVRSEVNAAIAARSGGRRPPPRQWTLEEKRRILHEAIEAKGKWGGVQRVQDKYGITSAHLVQWRDQIARAVQPLDRRAKKQSTTHRSEP